MDAGVLLREARARGGVTQRELAARAGTGQAAISDVETVAEVTSANRFEKSMRRPRKSPGYLFAPDPDSPDFRFFGKPPERPRRPWSTRRDRASHNLILGGFPISFGLEAKAYARTLPIDVGRARLCERLGRTSHRAKVPRQHTLPRLPPRPACAHTSHGTRGP